MGLDCNGPGAPRSIVESFRILFESPPHDCIKFGNLALPGANSAKRDCESLCQSRIDPFGGINRGRA